MQGCETHPVDAQINDPDQILPLLPRIHRHFQQELRQEVRDGYPLCRLVDLLEAVRQGFVGYSIKSKPPTSLSALHPEQQQ